MEPHKPRKPPAKPLPAKTAAPTNFIRNQIAADLVRGTYEPRHWAGKPGVYDLHASAPADSAKIRTRFPPEPNGYLHIGHAKSICLNFGLARDFDGRCHMRFDDTNPVKEDQEFVDGILDTVHWIGFDWEQRPIEPVPRERLLRGHVSLCRVLDRGGLCVCRQQSAEESARDARHADPGRHQFAISRPAETENPWLFREMRAGKHPEGSMILRAKIDMGSPNINMRDPAIYRIRFAEHHMTGDAWKVYPMYAYAHPVEDALENITHSICTLEFEDQRPFYDWVLERIVPLLRRPQYEARAPRSGRSAMPALKPSASSRSTAATSWRKSATSSAPAATSAAPKRCSRAGARTPTSPRRTPMSSSSCCWSTQSASRRCCNPRWTSARPTRFCCRTSTSSTGSISPTW